MKFIIIDRRMVLEQQDIRDVLPSIIAISVRREDLGTSVERSYFQTHKQ